eukprot:gene10421-biopygen1763
MFPARGGGGVPGKLVVCTSLGIGEVFFNSRVLYVQISSSFFKSAAPSPNQQLLLQISSSFSKSAAPSPDKQLLLQVHKAAPEVPARGGGTTWCPHHASLTIGRSQSTIRCAPTAQAHLDEPCDLKGIL